MASESDKQPIQIICNCNQDNRPFFSRHFGKIVLLIVLLIFIVLPVVGLFGFLASVGSEVEEQEHEEAVISGSGDDKIAVISIDGVIVENDPPYSFVPDSFTSARKIKKTLGEIKKDSSVKGVILRVNSPGGSAAASEEIYQEINAFKRETQMPIYSYFSDIAASGGLYVAMASDNITANPATITGSIGVIISYLNFQGLAEQYGVRNIVYKSGEFKDILNEFRNPTESEKQIMQSLVSDTYESFVNAIKDGRKLPDEKVRIIADGRVFSAKGAQGVNLVDQIGTFENSVTSIKNKLKLEKATVVEYGRPDFFETLFGAVSHKFNLSLFPMPASLFDQTSGTKLLYLYNP
jgi:protease IV